jgi:hypothetical protein
MRRAAATLTAVAAALALGACGGDSKEDDALARVCDARSDISKQVESLRGLTISEATTGQIGDSLTAIQADLKTIRDARADLSDDRRAEVEAANAAFTSSLRSIAGQLAGGTAGGDVARAQTRAALDQLATAYREAYGQVDCPEG